VVVDAVAGDRDQPGAEVHPLPLEGRDPPQRPQEHVADEVLGGLAVADPVVDEGVHLIDVVVVEAGERLRGTLLGEVHLLDDLGVADDPVP
jgi:hypothetical protein